MKTRATLATILLLMCSAPAMAQTEVNHRTVASNALQARADILRSTNQNNVVLKEFFLVHGGVVRLKWQFRSGNASTVATVVERAILPGESLCGEKTSTQTFVGVTCDLAVVAGDRLRIIGNGSSGSVEVRNARVFFDVKNVNKPAMTLKD